METAAIQEAVNAFTSSVHPAVIPITSGLINRTYKLCDEKGSYLLQHINSNVFTEPGKVQANYEKIFNHLAHRPGAVPVPAPLAFRNGSSLFIDSRQQYWRVFVFIEEAQCFQVVRHTEQAKQAADHFARLVIDLEDMDISQVKETIPGFHDLALRYHQFEAALYSAKKERLLHATSLAEQLQQREVYINLYDHITRSRGFKQRIMHHDAKLSNILFDQDGEIPVCIVDLDTCMPGYFFSDLGDLVRSMACRLDENNINLGHIHIEKNIYTSLLDGYLSRMENSFTPEEKAYIHYPGLLMIYMQSLRFLTDYLHGDIYYQVDHPAHNLERAANQLRLLEKMEEFLGREYGLQL